MLMTEPTAFTAVLGNVFGLKQVTDGNGDGDRDEERDGDRDGVNAILICPPRCQPRPGAVDKQKPPMNLSWKQLHNSNMYEYEVYALEKINRINC